MLNSDTERKIVNILNGLNYELTPSDVKFKLIVDDDRSIYKITAPGVKNHIFKTIGNNRKSETEFIDEYAKLVHFNQQASRLKQAVNIPEPIALIDDGGILMTECPGVTLKSMYFHSLFNLFDRREVARAIAHSASLLAGIHKLTLRRKSYFSILENRRDNLSRMVEAILQEPAEKTNLKTFTRAAKLFSLANEEVANIEICEVHGNYSLRNLLWNGTTLSTIDLEDSRTDTIYFDVALLLAELLNKNIYPTSRAFNANLGRIFTHDYTDQYQLDLQILTSYVVYHLVWSYYELATRIKSPNPLVATFLNYRKRQLVFEIEKQVKSAGVN